MPCLVGLLAIVAPRLTSVVLWFFTDFFVRAFAGRALLLVIGVLLMPFTTLAYAWAVNARGGVEGGFVVVVIVAVILDLSSWEGGRRHRRRS
jgi:hypothetical protein